jgi:hypothetical protein
MIMSVSRLSVPLLVTRVDFLDELFLIDRAGHVISFV